MDYQTAKQAAESWGVTLRAVQGYCRDGRIPGAKKYGNSWLLPAGCEKPRDPRSVHHVPVAGLPQYALYPYTAWPENDPDKAAGLVPEPFASITAASLAAYRGDYAPAKRCWLECPPGSPAMLTAALLCSSAAISTGDYGLFHRIEDVLERCKAGAADPATRELISMPLTFVEVNLSLPVLAPEWLKNGDFSIFSPALKPFLLYLYALHLRNTRDHSAARATARSALAFMQSEGSFTWIELYLYLIAAGSSFYLDDTEGMRRDLSAALRLGAPHGLVGPYAEFLGGYGGMLESLLSLEYPHLLKPITELWKTVHLNWANFRNSFTNESIATILTPQEQHVATLYARGMTYRQAAKALSMSESRVRTIMSEVYRKLEVSGKSELKCRIHTY